MNITKKEPKRFFFGIMILSILTYLKTEVAMNSTEKILTLGFIDKVGSATVRHAYDFFSDFESATLDDLVKFVQMIRKINLRSEGISAAIKKKDAIVESCMKSNVEICTFIDERYPSKLAKLAIQPHVLYLKGNANLLKNRLVAVIGTRMPTLEGKQKAKDYSKILCEYGIPVVSGLAYGCDTYAHKGALESDGKTIAVLPSGTDRIYPEENKALAQSILDKDGLLLSEYHPLEFVENYKFIARDRLQACLSEKVFVVETGVVGGTMHTVNFSQKQSRPVGVAIYKNMNISQRKGNAILVNNKNCNFFPVTNFDDFKVFINEKT